MLNKSILFFRGWLQKIWLDGLVDLIIVVKVLFHIIARAGEFVVNPANFSRWRSPKSENRVKYHSRTDKPHKNKNQEKFNHLKGSFV